MSQPALFVQDLVAATTQLSLAMDKLDYLLARYNEDNTVISGYPATPNARTDISTTDLTNALVTAYGQIKITYTTGSPTQKSYFDKLL
jgi:hypothetical protein